MQVVKTRAEPSPAQDISRSARHNSLMTTLSSPLSSRGEWDEVVYSVSEEHPAEIRSSCRPGEGSSLTGSNLWLIVLVSLYPSVALMLLARLGLGMVWEPTLAAKGYAR